MRKEYVRHFRTEKEARQFMADLKRPDPYAEAYVSAPAHIDETMKWADSSDPVWVVKYVEYSG